MIDLKAQIQKVLENNAEFLAKPSAGESWKLSMGLQDLENVLREHIEDISKPQITAVIEKLRARAPLSKEDRDYLRLWLVGDADYYVALENNYQEWLAEFNRLIEDLKKVDPSKTDFSSAATLRAKVLDATRVLGDILFFLGQKERIESFVDSTREIDPDEADLLIQILQGKISSMEC
ncbi:MAG: hypothetical protein WCO69_06815 [Candidatus Omnitrophota bacterium]